METRTCKYCAATVPDFVPQEDALQAIVRALCNGSPTIAASEMQYYARCAEREAKAWIDHLLQCAHSWPSTPLDDEILERIDQAFASVGKPEHFTDVTHCDECAEHDKTLRGAARETLSRNDLGNPGRDPITFSGADGIGYFFPALARFALLPDVWRDRDWYGIQLLTHLSWDAESNRFLRWCSGLQRAAVFSLLEHMAATRYATIEQCDVVDDLRTALKTWMPPTTMKSGDAIRDNSGGG